MLQHPDKLLSKVTEICTRFILMLRMHTGDTLSQHRKLHITFKLLTTKATTMTRACCVITSAKNIMFFGSV